MPCMPHSTEQLRADKPAAMSSAQPGRRSMELWSCSLQRLPGGQLQNTLMNVSGCSRRHLGGLAGTSRRWHGKLGRQFPTQHWTARYQLCCVCMQAYQLQQHQLWLQEVSDFSTVQLQMQAAPAYSVNGSQPAAGRCPAKCRARRRAGVRAPARPLTCWLRRADAGRRHLPDRDREGRD